MRTDPPSTSAGARGWTDLDASGAVLLLDYHRTPYRASGAPIAVPGHDLEVGWVGPAESGRRLLWIGSGPGGSSSRWSLDGIPVVARVVDDARIAPVLEAVGGHWRPTLAITRPGAPDASIWADDAGSVLLPFDPTDAITNLWTEAYLEELSPVAERVLRATRRLYYGLRPATPQRVRIGLRRLFARVQARTRFPRWPVEPALHDLYELLYRLLAGVVGHPLPALAPWPAGRRWALVLTHDVESDQGLPGIDALRAVERRHGLVSSWHFVPDAYDVPTGLRARLEGEGCEIGVHGLCHDGRDVEPRLIADRLPAMRRWAEEWGATGFRAPAMHRSWEVMRDLGFDHDSSFPDTDPFQPCRGGCCSWWPIENGPVVELPLTLPQDHTLFVILGRTGPGAWIHKTRVLRERNGLAQMLVHPDYLDTPGVLEAYAAFLDAFAGDPTMWAALPRDVSAWWRDRAASSIVAGPNGWEVVGPASATAEVVLLPPLEHPLAPTASSGSGETVSTMRKVR